MASEGPNSPANGSNVATVGTLAWSSPTRIQSSNDSSATAADAGLGSTTNYLVSDTHGFAIPSGATINGIVVEIERKVSPGSATDAHVKIVKGGTISATNRSAGAAWATSDQYDSFGSSSDLWGETWTDSDINAAGFGVALSCTVSGLGTVAVDHVRITVHYTEAAGAVTFFGVTSGQSDRRPQWVPNRSTLAIGQETTLYTGPPKGTAFLKAQTAPPAIWRVSGTRFIQPLEELISGTSCYGPNSPGTTSQYVMGGEPWVDPDNVKVLNDTDATAAIPSSGGETDRLLATNYGFSSSVPAGSVIVSVTARIRKNSDGAAGIQDNSVRLLFGGSFVGANKASGNWPASYDTTIYEWSQAEVAAAGLTAASIRDSSFGVSISATNVSILATRTAHIDHIGIIVCCTSEAVAYNEPGFIVPTRRVHPTWSPNRTLVAMGQETTLWTEPTRATFTAARAAPPARERASVSVSVKPVMIPPTQIDHFGWSQTTLVTPVQPIPIRRRTQSLMDLVTVPQGPDSWLTNVFRSGHRRERPRLNRGWFAVPMEKFAPDIDSWLTMRKQPVFPPARAGQSQSLFLTLPYAHDPNILFYRDSRAVQPRARAGQSRVFYTDRSDIANYYSWQLVHRSPIVQPKWTANTTRIVSDFETAYPYGFPVQDVKATAPRPIPTIIRNGNTLLIGPNLHQDVPRPGFITASRGLFPTYYRPSATYTPILEPTSTGILEVGWMTARVMRRPILLIRGRVSQLFYAPGLIDTYTRLDDRDSGGAGMGASSTGGGGYGRTSSGAPQNRTGTGRPPNP